MRIKTILMVISITLSMSSCISYDFSKQKVQQGNLLSKARIERLKIGMSKDDVAILIGTSLISPMFNNDRWDYAYTWRNAGNPMLVRNLSLFFVNNRLVKIEHNRR